jgi:hypothetical protein
MSKRRRQPPRFSAWGRVALAITALYALGCGPTKETSATPECAPETPSCSSSCDASSLRRRARFDLPTPTAPLRVAFFLLLPHTTGAVTLSEAGAFIDSLADNARTALAPCQLELEVERAEVWSVAPDRLALEVTRPSSWAGAAPPGTPDPDAFNHAQNDRLPEALRELLVTLRDDLDAGVLSIVIPREVAYWSGGLRHTAGGASLPPVIFHDAADFPLRQSVFAATIGTGCDALPVAPTPRLIGHELGHMLLDTAQHDPDPENLMHELRGPKLRPEQCAVMQANVPRLYGASPLVDPGPDG